jgi:cell wall-associated NlpC family hydrolase
MLGRVSTTLSPVAGAALLGLAVTLAACSSAPKRASVPDRSIEHRSPDRQWAQRAVEIAMQYRGAPYRWGGEEPSGFDCSGFVRYVYAQVGVSLPHNAAKQYQYGTPVSRSDLQPGDLVFFDRLRHNGIYTGEGRFIHSRQTGKVVAVANLDDDWYRTHWAGGRRL